MISLLKYKLYISFFINSRNVVLNSTHFVKAYLITLVLFSPFLTFAANDYTLSKGQVIEISSKNITHYIIGNKEIISARNLKSKDKLIIKAKMAGYTDLKIFRKDTQEVLKLYVLSKKDQFELIKIKNSIDEIDGLDTKIKSKKLHITGQINTVSDYLLFNEINSNSQYIAINSLKIAANIKSKILSKIYLEFFDNFYDQIKCNFRNLKVICFTTKQIYEDKAFITRIQKKYSIQILPSSAIWNQSNLEVSLKIFQIERLDGKEIDFGLSKLNISIDHILKNNYDTLKEKIISLNQSHYNVSTLSRPKVLINYNQELEVKIGAEIPFTIKDTHGVSNTTWKFAGLRLKLTPKRRGHKINIDYQTQITRPLKLSESSALSINGSKQRSTLNVEPSIPIQIFEVDLKTDDRKENRIPFISQFPILGSLFTSNSTSQTYKKIIAIMKIEELE